MSFFGFWLPKFMPLTLWGGKGGGSAPAPPDPYAVAGATTQTNNQSAAYDKALNLNNYSNPFGSQQTTQTGTDPSTGAPIYNTNTTADPQLQGMLSSLMGQTGQSGATNQQAMSGLMGVNSQLGQLGSQLNQGQAAQAGQQGQQAAYAAQTQYLDPQFAQQGESLNASLANSGLTPGSQAYNNAQLNQSNAKQQAYSNAANQSILTGSQIGAQALQNQESGISTQAGLLGQQASNYGQQANIGQLPYANLQSIAGMIPGYSGPAQSSASPANVGQNVYSNYQGELNNYNASQQSSNSMMGGLFGLGSAGILGMSMSDRRVKRNIKRLGVINNGLPWYEFRYVWDRVTDPKRQGVMSDEVRAVRPEAVAKHISGFDMVNYQSLAA